MEAGIHGAETCLILSAFLLLYSLLLLSLKALNTVRNNNIVSHLNRVRVTITTLTTYYLLTIDDRLTMRYCKRDWIEREDYA